MIRCTRLLSSSKVSVYFSLVSAVLAFVSIEAGAQERPGADVFQKASFKPAEKTCTVESSGAVTALVKNGVELSVTDDWDCDGVPDAYDNCVGMANPSQADANSSGIGDVCESAATIRSGPPVRVRPATRSETRKARPRSVDPRVTKGNKTRRDHPKRLQQAKPKRHTQKK